MQEKPSTVAAYAAGASLAAIALFYVFGPNYTIDGEDSLDGNRKKSIVGLSNPANDCFINSVLQALAGLGGLRVYLIRELHRRDLDGPELYNALPALEEIPRGQRPEKLRELQQGLITRALKDMLDRLNERPIYKKTISARSFIQALEYAFRTRISRNQQDAQEFLQIIAERLCDEYHAGVKARQRLQQSVELPQEVEGDVTTTTKDSTEDSTAQPAEVEVRIDDGSEKGLPAIIDTKLKELDNDYGFPFEGKLESQIVCQFCQYQYKPNQTAFVNLTLQVPQKSSTTLSSCFDGLLKTEYIDDFRCDRCRLQHAIELKTQERAAARSEKETERLGEEIDRIHQALQTDPEQALEGVRLPPAEAAPKRRIARHMRITVFPKIIAIHLSRSIFDHSSSSKNAAKVSFPERLPLGGILNQKWFKLLAIVCHKGSHNSGHYESFRRNNLYAPFSTPDVFSSYAQSRVASENPSAAPSPRLAARRTTPDSEPASISLSTTTVGTPSSPSLSGTSSLPSPSPSSASSQLNNNNNNNNSRLPAVTTANSSRLSLQSSLSRSPAIKPTSSSGGGSGSTTAPSSQPLSSLSPTSTARLRRRRRANDRWWRISDEKVKECKTSDVMGMQKEVYLLFYETEAVEPV